jgi:hypothetical protein
MSQARYGAEAGVHDLVNYLMNTGYTPASNVDATSYPVRCTGGGCAHTGTCASWSTIATAVANGCVVVGYSTATSNNPDARVHTPTSNVLAVNSSGSTTNAALGTVTFTAAAVLLAQRTVTPYGTTGSTSTIQTWQIVSDGTVPPSTAAIVEVSATLERQFGSAQTFAVFATGTGCGAITLGGNVQTASTSDGTTVVDSGGNVGTNGNMDIQGHVDVHGSLSSPKTGIGTCTNGTNVTALTEGGAATVDNNALVTLPQALSFPTPTAPSPNPPTATQSTCAQFAVVLPATCTTLSGTVTIDPMGTTVSLGNLGANVVLKGGSYNINSIGNVAVTTGTSLTGSNAVTINMAGRNSDGTQMATPFGMTSQTITNPSMDASKLEILYAGTGSFDMTGGSTASMLLYAPNATVTTHGNADFYGSLLVAGVTSSGTPRFIYDTRLQNKIVTMGNFVMSSFSWKKY